MARSASRKVSPLCFLRWWYGRYNRLYFGGKLPRCRIGLMTSLEDCAEVYANQSPPVMNLNRRILWSARQVQVALLHEMTHLKIRDELGHGRRFVRELHRLMRAGAYDGLL